MTLNETFGVVKNKLLQSLRSDIKLLFLGLAFLTLNYLLPHFISTLLLTAVFSLLIQKYVTRTFFNSTISSIVLGFIIYVLALSFTASLLWALNIKIPLSVLSTVGFIFAYILSILTCKNTTPKVRRKFIDQSDLIGLSVILIFSAAYSMGVLRHQTKDQSVRTVLVQGISYGIDDLTHLNMVKDTVEANKGILLGTKDSEYISKKETTSYPKMSHLVASVFVAQSNSTTKLSNKTILLSYAIAKTFLFILVIFVLVRTVCELAVLSMIRMVGIVIPLSCFVIFSFLQPFVQEGFFSTWPIFLALPFALRIIMSLRNSVQHGILFGMTTTLLFMSWTLVALPFALILGLSALTSIGSRKKLSLKNILVVFIGPLFGAIGFLQIIVQFFDKTPINNSEAINAVGGIMSFPLLYLLIFASLVIPSLIYMTRTSKKYSYDLLAIFFASFFAMVGLVGASNILATGSIQYFFIKTAYLLLFAASIVVVPYVSKLISQVLVTDISDNKFNKLNELALVSSGAIALVLVFYISLNAGTPYPRYSVSYLLGGSRNITAEDSLDLLNSKKETIIVNQDSILKTYYLSTASRSLNSFDYCIGDIHGLLTTDSKSIAHCNDRSNITFIFNNDPLKEDEITTEKIYEVEQLLTNSGIKFTIK